MKARFNFMTRPEYKKIIADYQNGLKSIISKNKMSVKEVVINEEVNELIKNTHLSMQQFVKSEKELLNNEMTSIRESYKRSKSVYSNPQEEILRRQDFDLELSAMRDDDVMAFLSDKERTPSEYELRKIASLDKFSSETQARVTSHLNLLKRPYEQDSRYQKLNASLVQLEIIDKQSVRSLLLYFPSGDNQTSNISLTSLNTMQNNLYELGKEFDRVNEALNSLSEVEIRETPKKERTQLSSITEKTKQREYDNFDSRAIKGSSDYDITHRFKYLRERYDDKTSDRFDIMKDDYDVEAHYKYLEEQHDKRMKYDSEFKEQYETAAKEATESED